MVCQHTTHLSTRGHLSKSRANILDSEFPKLSSLTYLDPSTTYHLSQLTRLTKVAFGCHINIYGSDYKLLFVDLGSLQDLPLLHTLQLESVPLERLSPATPCALAALTQLRTLQLTGCVTRTRDGGFAHNLRDLSSQADNPDRWTRVPRDLAAIQQLTQLQVLDSLLWIKEGLTNLQKVRGPSSQGQLQPVSAIKYHLVVDTLRL